MSDPADSASFGYREVAAAEKAPLVRRVFDAVAHRNDHKNDNMSGGVHRLWKGALIAEIAPRAGETILAVAGGTGDVAAGLVARQPGAKVVICDINEAMVRRGRDRMIDEGRLPGLAAGGVGLAVGDAEGLPFPDASADAYVIAFGLRNVTRIDAALAEARRVLKPGGRFFCLEFSRVVLPGLDRLYDLYSFRLLPTLGELVTGDRASYEYLVESIRRFPPQAELAQRMRAAGLDRARWRNLSGGIAAIHAGWRL